MKTLIASLILLSTTAFAQPSGRPERLMGYLPLKSGVIFQVASGGCTTRADFIPSVTRSETTDITELTLVRTKPDLCYPFVPTGVRFKFSYEDLGIRPGERFTIKNENGVVLGWIWPETQP